MKKTIYILIAVFISAFSTAQGFQDKEFLRYRVHYGFLNAGFASLKVTETMYNGKQHYHVLGEGSSTGAVRAFFKVDDRYETYFDKNKFTPSKFIRKVREGKHEKDRVLTFDNQRKVVTVNDLRAKTVTNVRFENQVQDMLSAFYYLRTKSNNDFKTGEFMKVDVFMDGEVYPFSLKVEGRERIKTKFGYINSIKLTPYVQAGRVFEAKESVSMWVSDDLNLIPLKLKANLVVGSLDMDLHNYRNVKYPLNFK
ncbi:MAG: DUF3108 domain-containing protein [Flavobacteriaceae bacterium]|nr:DUF3108 domain-containing protein [Flavobacteriaceae bacterium]